MPSNIVIIAAAGSRKTTHLVQVALANPSRRTLITTYTRDGVAEIEGMFTRERGCVPPHVSVMSWYAFLLKEGARPYQLALTSNWRIRSIDFRTPPTYVRRDAADLGFYTNSSRDLYANRVADFIMQVNKATNGAVIRRLCKAFDHVMIDEMQDLSGYDFNVLDELFAAEVDVTCVGDPRQGTFSTTTARKNRQYRASNIMEWVKEPGRMELLTIEHRIDCYRCSQGICNYADALYPNMPTSISRQESVNGRDSIIFLSRADVAEYVVRVNPQVLRYDKDVNTEGIPALNFGVAKGRTFPHVLIFPTKKYQRYMRTGDLRHAGGARSLAKMYVAITRAQFSVAIVSD